jgi:hypothetical protein
LLGSACLAAEEVTITSDITRLGVGARPLGMGKTFTGLSDDISAMYTNPGALGKLKEIQAMTMSGSFANLANYLTFAAIVPTNMGTFGIGYSGTGMGFTTPALDLVEIATGEYRVLPSTTETVSFNYSNYVIALAYGTTLFRPELSAGATFKLFTEGISGTSNADAHGYDMDVGLHYRPNPALSLGALARNVIPASMGGKVTWNTQQVSTLPMSYVLGANLKLTALKDAGDINVMLDYEHKPYETALPGSWHTGVEWWITPFFAARGGVDQDVVGRGTGTELELSSNSTAGLSLFVGGVRFDYAYHQYNHLSENDTHYFSIVYAYEKPKRIPIEIISPKDKSTVRQAKVAVTGTAKDRAIVVLKVNNRIVPLNLKDRSFSSEVEMKLAKNTIWVAGYDAKGKLVDSQHVRVLRLLSFIDVAPSHWARDPVEELATLGILSGFPNGKFKPDDTLKRAHLLVKIMQIGQMTPAAPVPMPFVDVRKTQPSAPYLKAGYDKKLAYGYPDRTFKPSRLADMPEAIAFAVRFSKLPQPKVLERPFQDISARHWAIKDITAAKENKMLDFLGPNLNPKKKFTRAEFAYILSHVPPIRTRIDELLDFETGYQTSCPY